MILAFVVLVGGGCSFISSDKDNGEENVEVTEYDNNWTSADNTEGITENEISGVINEQEVNIKSVQISKWDDEYSWSFSDKDSGEICDLIVDDKAVNFNSVILEEGTFEKKMEDNVDFDNYHAYYHYEQEDGVPMSINVGWAARVVVEKIDRENNKVEGYAKFEFEDDKTMIEGRFVADLCE